MGHLDSHRVDSVAVFKPIWFCWRLLGALSWQVDEFTFARAYDIGMNLLIYIWYPLHLTIGLVLLPMQHDIYKNISMTITCIVCTLKHYAIRWKLRSIHDMMDLFGKLDERVLCGEERAYFAGKSIKRAKRMVKMYFSVYMGANVAALMAVLLDAETRLMYPAWFPFDWSSSSALYYLAILYQFVGVTILIVVNFTNDAFIPTTLCLASGQVHLLSMRVAKLGYDERLSCDQREHELKLCIEDHIRLINLFNVMEDSLSIVQLSLFISSGMNICVVLVYLFFFVDSLLSYIYYILFLIAIGVELFPIYYFGSLLQEEFNDLPYAIFSSNWIAQRRSYRKSIVIFNEVALRKMTVMAGGIVPTNLDSFFDICKTTYSLFAVAMSMK